nr:zinc finger, CCHC-type [Tanacetum cinerariifolium]
KDGAAAMFVTAGGTATTYCYKQGGSTIFACTKKEATGTVKPPHPDTKYLSQILSVPKPDQFCGDDDLEWLFNRKEGKKPPAEDPQVQEMKVDGNIDKYKARLVIQCFRQKEGIDLFDTYAPVARIFAIRLLLALSAIHDLVIHQMDVITAFLNGDLDEEIYIKQPEGFVMPARESRLEYFRDIGCLMYAMISTRPDIGFAIGNLSSGYPSVIEGYSDASWINNMKEDHSSSSAGNEAEWLTNLIYEIPLWPKPIYTISIRCDIVVTLAKAYSQVYNGKSRHLADHLTKGLARDLVRKAAIGIGTYGMAIDYCIMKEGMSILRGWNSILGISSSERENGKKGTTLPSRELHDKKLV